MAMIIRLLVAAVFVLCPILQANAHGGGVLIVPIFVPAPAVMPAPSLGNYAGIHTVGIISAIGATLDVRDNHSFHTAHSTIKVDGWAIDDEVIRIVSEQLGARFTFKSVPYDKADFATQRNLRGDKSELAIHTIVAEMPSVGIDAWLVIWPESYADIPGGVGGLCIYNAGGDPLGLLTPTPTECANYEVEMIDAHTGQTIAEAYSRLPNNTFARRNADTTLLTNAVATITGNQQDALHSDFETLVATSLRETLRTLNLTSYSAP